MGGVTITLSALTLPGLLWKIQEKIDAAEEVGLTDVGKIIIEKPDDSGQWFAAFHAGK